MVLLTLVDKLESYIAETTGYVTFMELLCLVILRLNHYVELYRFV